MATVKGTRELRARIKALRISFKPAGKAWGNATVSHMRPAVPVRTGRLRRSFRVKSATQRRATVSGHYTAFFVDAGTKAHLIVPRKARKLRWEQEGRTIFAKKVHHPRTTPQRFRMKSAIAGLRDAPIADSLVDAWNRAA